MSIRRRAAGAVLAGTIAFGPAFVAVEIISAAPAGATEEITIVGIGISKSGKVWVEYSDGVIEIWG